MYVWKKGIARNDRQRFEGATHLRNTQARTSRCIRDVPLVWGML